MRYFPRNPLSVGVICYAYSMNKFENVKASDLRTGMVLASGFVVTHNAYRGVRTPSTKVDVEGYYPGGANKRDQWNRNTVVQVLV